jgi:dUTP pyrophosphatase
MAMSDDAAAVAERRLDAMRRHIEALLKRLGPNVTVVWIAWPDRARIVSDGDGATEVQIPRIRSDVTYAIALHELGHIFGQRQQPNYDKITHERWAWRWARENAIVWTPAMTRADAESLRTYAENTDHESRATMNTITIRIMRLPHAADLPLPAYQTAHTAGLDLVAAVPADVTSMPVIIAPGGRAAIPTGLAFALPQGLEGQIRPRSGLALHHGVTVLNSPGTLDPDYRGELHVILANFGSEPFVVERGARIAQLVLARVARVDLHEVASLDDTTRGARGFGSTGA